MRAKCEGQHRRSGISLRGLPGLLMLIICAPISATSAEAASAKAQGEPPASTCPNSATDRAAIANIDERLEITLKDGRSLRLAGLEPPRPTPDAPDFDMTARDALNARMGEQIAFIPLASRPDRWGRIPVFAFFDQPGAAPVSAGQVLLAQGFARFMPEPEARPCRALFLAAEAAARSANLGLWRDPFYAVIKATDRDAFAERAATNVIVEGRLTGVDKGPLRTYLQFAPRRERAFSVTILQRNVKKLEQAGFDFSALIGRTLRVRGLLDLRFGPQIEVSGADEIELLPEAEGDRGLEPQGSR